jgi:hypothetical protein
MRLHLADGRECAMRTAVASRLPRLDFGHKQMRRTSRQRRWLTMEGQRSARSRVRRKPRCYLTSFSETGERPRGPSCDFVFDDLSIAATSRNTASHNAFNSESSIRLSLIRSSRMATDTNCAVSRSPPRTRAARHLSRVARTARNFSSELVTGVFPVSKLAR